MQLLTQSMHGRHTSILESSLRDLLKHSYWTCLLYEGISTTQKSNHQ